MYVPGIRFQTTPTDLDPIKSFQMVTFDGAKWNGSGEPIHP